MKRISIFLVLVGMALCGHSQLRYFQGMLQASQQVPPNASTAGGMVIVKYNVATRYVEVIGSFSGLLDTIQATHIHTGSAGSSGPVVVPLTFSGVTTGTISGSATVSQAFEDSLLAGKTYVNVHSKSFPAGEIRAQLIATTEGQTEFLSARLQGAQQVPPNASMAMGKATVLLDKATLTVYLTGDFHGLAAPASAAHIHQQVAGQNGGVVVPLTQSTDTTGTLMGSATVSQGFADALLSGGAYVNIHDSLFPGGEIRGQLTTLPQKHFFTAVLQGSQQVPSNTSMAGNRDRKI